MKPHRRKYNRPSATVELKHVLGTKPHAEPDREDTSGRRAGDKIELTRDGNAKRLFQRRQDRRRECAFDTAPIESENPEGNSIGDAPPDKRKTTELVANDADNALDILLQRKTLVGRFVETILERSHHLGMVPDIIAGRSAKASKQKQGRPRCIASPVSMGMPARPAICCHH